MSIKNLKQKLISLALVGAFTIASPAFAQTTATPLPSPGIKPNSIFYFLDRWGESIQQFFTFNPQAKARLQVKFAQERIAEIKALAEEDKPQTKAIEKARALLQSHIAFAAEVVNMEGKKGQDVSELARELNQKFSEQEKLMVGAFQSARRKLNAEKKALAQETAEGKMSEQAKEKLEKIKEKEKELKEKKFELKQSMREKKKELEKKLDEKTKEEAQKQEELADEQEKTEDDKIDEGKSEDAVEVESEDSGKNESGDQLTGESESQSESEKSDKGDEKKSEKAKSQEIKTEDTKASEDSKDNEEKKQEETKQDESKSEND